MTVTPTWRQPGIVISWLFLAGVCVTAALLRWPGGDFSFGGMLVLWLLGWARLRSIRLEITETTVRVRRGYLRQNSPRQAARSRIRAIHYYPDMISFRGPNGKPLMRTKAEWSLKQMIGVGAVLEVPVYDNRRCLNLLPVRVGQLVYNPSGYQPVR